MLSALNNQNRPINKQNFEKPDNKLNKINFYPMYPSRLKIQIREINLFIDNEIKSLFFKKELNFK